MKISGYRVIANIMLFCSIIAAGPQLCADESVICVECAKDMLNALANIVNTNPPLLYKAKNSISISGLNALTQQEEVNDGKKPLDNDPVLTYFHSKQIPNISLVDFALYIAAERVFVDKELIPIAAVLFWRFQASSNINITPAMQHRLMAACVLVAAKVHQDKFPCNSLFASQVGVELWEMNRLEKALVHSLDWSTLVTQDEVEEFIANFCHSTPSQNGQSEQDAD